MATSTISAASDPSALMPQEGQFTTLNQQDGAHIPDYSAFEGGMKPNGNGVSSAEDVIKESDSSVSTYFRHDDDATDVTWAASTHPAAPTASPPSNGPQNAAASAPTANTGSRLLRDGYIYDPNESFSNHFDKSLSLNSAAPNAPVAAGADVPKQPNAYSYQYTNTNTNTNTNMNMNGMTSYGAPNYPNGSAAQQPGAPNAYGAPPQYGNTSQYPYTGSAGVSPQPSQTQTQTQNRAAYAPQPGVQAAPAPGPYGYGNARPPSQPTNSQFAGSQPQYNAGAPATMTRSTPTSNMVVSGNRDRNVTEYDLQSESIQLPTPDGIEQLMPQPSHEPYSNKHQVNCSPDIMRCTLRAVPSTKELLGKARLPFGVVLHPFKDVQQLAVLQVSNIVRCKVCRTYINPFASFVDSRRWRCNVCQRANELPEDFLYDPATRTYGDVFVRPEVRSATVEYIAPAEYAVRPPQPAVFVFLLDVSPAALVTDYMTTFCNVLRENLERLPGDARKQVAFITYDSAVHFYTFNTQSNTKKSEANAAQSDAQGPAQAQSDSDYDTRRLFRVHVCADLDELSVPVPTDALLVNVQNNRETIRKFLSALPSFWNAASPKRSNTNPSATATTDQRNALGSALTLAQKLLSPIGGRITIINGTLPSVGVGALQPREIEFRKSPSFTTDTPSGLLTPAIDMYKRLGLECSTAQIGVDVFALGAAEYVDLASIAPAARFSAGAVYYYPLHGKSQAAVTAQLRKFEADLKRYLVRKLGFEAVLRIRCTKGISIQNFFGNFFVRATDLCNLANVTPDLGCAAHLRIDESLSDYVNVTIQCAILYTHAAGERRIRVHTLSVPITDQVGEVLVSADQQAIVSLIARMASERAVARSLADARDGIITSLIDVLTALRMHHVTQYGGVLTAPHSLRLIGLYVLALLKNAAMKPTCPSIDERVYALEQWRQLPTQYFILKIYPALYCLDVCEDGGFLSRELDLSNSMANSTSSVGSLSLSTSAAAPTFPPLIRLCSRNVSVSSVYLLDNGDALYLYVGDRVRPSMLQQLFGVEAITAQQCAEMNDLPALNNLASNYVRRFVQHLRSRRAFGVSFRIVKEDPHRLSFLSQFLVEDRNEVTASESNHSYLDFLANVREQMK